ncbi:UNVERIFIED_CONTAM: hypothetical protein FKN15_055109 [Acipenser sinensis]
MDDFKAWISKDHSDATSARCSVCHTSFTVKHDGVSAVKTHQTSDRHKQAFQAQKSSDTLSNFFVKKNTEEEDSVIASEISLVYHGVTHHHSYLSQDCGNKLYAKVFPDSKITKKLHCGRTKSEAIVQNVLCPYAIESVVKEICDGKPFSLSLNATNKEHLKHFPVAVTYFTKDKGVKKGVVDFYEDSNEMLDAIAAHVREVFTTCGLNLKNVVSYGADNATVNYSVHHSVYTNLKNENGNLLTAGYNCHLLHNAAKHGCKRLAHDVESFVIKVYNEFSCSAKCVSELRNPSYGIS